MPDYNAFKRGSEWRRWDLHVHTPGTLKNDQFTGQTVEEKWNNYLRTLNEYEGTVNVIGVTDYLSIDNYFIIKDYLSRGLITHPIDLVIPNVELRILPVTGSATPINLHCIFNPEIDEEINDRFFSQLSFQHSNTNYSAQRNELIRLGRSLSSNPTQDEAYYLKKGAEQYVIEFSTLRNVFEKDQELRKNTLVVVSNKSNDGVSGIIRHSDFLTNDGSQLDTIRQSIYQFSDAVFSSNDNDRLYFTGKGVDRKEDVISKCGSLKPCFHGSDAHSNDKVFNPDNNKYCWIKADPTFEGLRQTLYEPEDRVTIQGLKPDFKSERHIISELKYHDDSNRLFGNQSILLNENLNSIIGGKSAGKSLLLCSAARSIDPEQVTKAQERLGFEGYHFDTPYDFEVVWKNGEVNLLNDEEGEKNQKIIYIPQLYINYLVERDNKDDLNQLVGNILQQDAEFKTYYDSKINSIKELNASLNDFLIKYLQIRDSAIDLSSKSKEVGKSVEIRKNITKLKGSISEGQKLSSLNQEEITQYNELQEKKIKVEQIITSLSSQQTILREIVSTVSSNKESLIGNNDDASDNFVKGAIDRLFDQIGELPDSINRIRLKIIEDYDILLKNLKEGIETEDIENKLAVEKRNLSSINNDLKPYINKLQSQKELQKLSGQLESETKRLNEAISIEKQFQDTLKVYQSYRNRISHLLNERITNYEDIVEKVNSTMTDVGSGITLKCNLIFKQGELPLYHQVNKAAIAREHFFNSLFDENLLLYKQIPEFFNKQLWIQNSKTLKDARDKEFEIPLNQGLTLEEILRGLIKDSFVLDYTVTYKDDELLRMSPGKKGTVLLILFLQISSSEYPILIDQPEDNLDNRTIYDLLCNMIRDKKKERQIIIVSHNANLVVATDSENVIVANQAGQEDVEETSAHQFEYVNGSIEHTNHRNESIPGVLYQQGIREHICDVLEGGDEAFKQRERKYALD